MLCVSVVLGAAQILLRRVGSASTLSRLSVVEGLEAGPMGASRRIAAHAMPGFGPLYSEPCAGRDGIQAAGFIAGRSCRVC